MNWLGDFFGLGSLWRLAKEDGSRRIWPVMMRKRAALLARLFVAVRTGVRGWRFVMCAVFLAAVSVALIGCFTTLADAGIEYHFVPGMNGQPFGDAQFVSVAPVVGPSNFNVLVSGAFDRQYAEQRCEQFAGLFGQMGFGCPQSGGGGRQRDSRPDPAGWQVWRRISATPVPRCSSVDVSDICIGRLGGHVRTESGRECAVNLQALFPGMTGIRSISVSQGNWPGKVDFTQASQPLFSPRPGMSVWRAAAWVMAFNWGTWVARKFPSRQPCYSGPSPWWESRSFPCAVACPAVAEARRHGLRWADDSVWTRSSQVGQAFWPPARLALIQPSPSDVADLFPVSGCAQQDVKCPAFGPAIEIHVLAVCGVVCPE